MTRRGAAFLALALAAGCGGDVSPIADEDLLLRVTAGVGSVEIGKAFPITVVRVWAKDCEPEEWRDEALAPLTVRLVATARREDERHVEETRHYEARAFALDEVRVPAPTFRAVRRGAADPSAARVVTAEPIVLRVRPALDPRAPGAPEFPGEPLSEPLPRPLWAGIGAAAVVATALALVLRRRAARLGEQPAAPERTATSAPSPSPRDRALQRIEALRARDPRTADEVLAWHVEAAALSRDYVFERFAVGTPEMTTEELLATAPGAQRAGLADVLAGCDLVKFAREVPAAAERARLLASAEALVGDRRARPQDGHVRHRSMGPHKFTFARTVLASREAASPRI